MRGKGVVLLSINEDGNGKINVNNKDSTPVTCMMAYKDNGLIEVYNKDGERTGFLP